MCLEFQCCHFHQLEYSSPLIGFHSSIHVHGSSWFEVHAIFLSLSKVLKDNLLEYISDPKTTLFKMLKWSAETKEIYRYCRV